MEKDLLDYANDVMFLVGGVLIVAYVAYLAMTSKQSAEQSARLLSFAEETVALQRETNVLLRGISEGRGNPPDA